MTEEPMTQTEIENEDVFGGALPSGAVMEDGVLPEGATNDQGPAGASSGSSGGSTDDATRSYTTAEVAAHASESSCWSIIRGDVYDLTNWIAQHPGGKQAILGLCGKDGTAAFEGQHGGAARQENTLAGFKIGVLAR